MLLIVLGAVMALQAWTWRDLSGRVAAGALTRAGAIVRYTAWAFVPPCVFVVGVLGAVGLEAWFGVTLLSEPMGRAVLPIEAVLLGAAGLGSREPASQLGSAFRRTPGRLKPASTGCETITHEIDAADFRLPVSLALLVATFALSLAQAAALLVARNTP